MRSHRISVAVYHQMIDSGILESNAPYELIDGVLVMKDRSARGEDPTSVGCEHIWAINNLQRLSPGLRSNCHLQTQGPITLSGYDEPEPDGSIIRGDIDDYKHRKPVATDASSVIEVADNSLTTDRSRKRPIYANSGIPQYVIINLPDRVVENDTKPQVGKGRYACVETLQPNEKINFVLPNGRALQIAVEKLLH